MYIVIVGSPSEGFSYVGPFPAAEMAVNYMQNESGDWWVSRMEPPAISTPDGVVSAMTKSDIMKEIAKELGLPVVDLKLAEMEPGDLIGFPMPE